MNRNVLWAILVIGVALIVTPFAISLPSKASAGERMMTDFQPIMQPDNVQTTAYYYNDVFTPLGKVVPAMSAKNVAKFQQYVAGMKSVRLTPAEMARLQQQFPQLAAMFGGLPVMLKDFDSLITLMRNNEQTFARVPGGLTHYKPLVTTMQANVNDFKQVNSLPSFDLFTWFFAVPGAALVLLSGFGLFGHGLGETRFSIGRGRPTHA